jgi:hypothetical protein
MTAIELLDANGHETPFEGVAATITREQVAPDAYAALRAVLDKHSEFKIYDECGHQHREGDPGVLSIENVGLTCEDGYEYSICRECCTGGSGEYQTEDCASHDHNRCWPCDTVQAITEALEESA